MKFCEKSGIELHEISDEQLQKIHPALTKDLRALLNVEGAIASRTSDMATSKKSVTRAISELNKELSKVQSEISKHQKRLSGMIRP